MLTSVWDRVHCGTDPPCLHGTGSKLELYGSTWNHFQMWIRFVHDSRSDRCRIPQVPCKHKAYLYQLCTGSERNRPPVNVA